MALFRDVADASFLLVALLLALISVALISNTFKDHLRNYKYPSMQMCCLRILALAPVYAILSWLMMVLLPLASFIEVFRDMYETYTLYCYWFLLVLWVGGQRKAIDVLAGVPDSTADCMLCPLLPAHGLPRVTGLTIGRFQNPQVHFRYWRLALFQWMIFKPSLTLAHSILLAVNLGGLSSRTRSLSLASTFIGMHAVLDTYSCLLPHLKGLQGSVKFLCIKMVVWVTLFQQAIINALLGYGAIPQESGGHYSSAERAQRLLSTVTIVEMALFSLVLSYVFSRRSMQRVETEPPGSGKSLQPADIKKSGGKSGKGSKGATPKSVLALQGSEKSKLSGDLGEARHTQVMVGNVLASGDVISRQGRGAHVEEQENWDVDIETEDDHSERVSFRQVLALWDFIIWRTVEDRHHWALTGRSSPPPEREPSEINISPRVPLHPAPPPSAKTKVSAA